MRIVFILDKFVNQLMGGAELSMQTHIDSCPYDYVKVNCSEFHPEKYNVKNDFLIFGNFTDLNLKNLLPQILQFNYAVEECDYKYCVYRSSHVHKCYTGKECDCHKQEHGQNVFKFFENADFIAWKSIAQRQVYYDMHVLAHVRNMIVSGVFSERDIDYILSLKGLPSDGKYLVLNSASWLKAYKESFEYCLNNKIPCKAIGGLSHKEFLNELARSEGLVYLPNGYDVSCRMVTEAKLMGKKIITNNLVQHITEKWFNDDTLRVDFLRSRNSEFWKNITEVINEITTSTS